MDRSQARHFQSVCRHLRVHVAEYERILKAHSEAKLEDTMNVPFDVQLDVIYTDRWHMQNEMEQVLEDMLPWYKQDKEEAIKKVKAHDTHLS